MGRHIQLALNIIRLQGFWRGDVQHRIDRLDPSANCGLPTGCTWRETFMIDPDTDSMQPQILFHLLHDG
jgi:hypothetical protein